MKSELIFFKDYSFHYEAQEDKTLKNINLTISKGQRVLIVGPSGSGKSTLGKTINGLIPLVYKGISSGKTSISNSEPEKRALFEIAKDVGTVLQDPDGQFIGLTVAEDIAFSLENSCFSQEEMKEKVIKSASKIGIKNLLNSRPQELSGGQKQKVSLAGILIDSTPILLFDEPLANLDPAAGKQTIELIDKINKELHSTIIIIEHRLEDVLHMKLDLIVVMDKGEVVASLPPNILLTKNILQSVGIREPLFLTALKYANVSISPEMHPAYIDTLKLNENDKTKVIKWYSSAEKFTNKLIKEPILEVKNLNFEYTEEKQALSNVSFTLNKGDVLAIVGKNGAGKSTLSKVICGFEKIQQGDILLHNKSIKNLSITDIASKIGFVMQNPNQMISKPMIFDEVALSLINQNLPEKEIKDRVEKTLKICGLHKYRNWPISALSFGQKKRVTIASVLVSNPEIILLDEPTAGQDFKHYTEIMKFLMELNKIGITIVLITHDMHLMIEYANRVIVMADSKLIADTTASKVLSNPVLTEKASLRETSLHSLALMCGIIDVENFVQHFINYDKEVRNGQ